MVELTQLRNTLHTAVRLKLDAQEENDQLRKMLEDCKDALDSCHYHCSNQSCNDSWHFDEDLVEKARKSVDELKK
jgi:hypothetical protein